jgi:hypothetical protein
LLAPFAVFTALSTRTRNAHRKPSHIQPLLLAPFAVFTVLKSRLVTLESP